MAELKDIYALIKKEQPKLLSKQDNPNKHLHGFDLPFRMVVVGPSGSSKTSFVANLIMTFCEGKGTFQQIFITTKCSDEPIYSWLKTKSNSIIISEGMSTLPKLTLDQFPKGSQSLVILDDLQGAKDQSVVEDYYVRCRKLNVSIIFIAQNWYKITPIIRGNASYVAMLRLSGQRDCKAVLSELGAGLTKEKLMELYHYSVKTKGTPLIIDLSAPMETRYRKGFAEQLRVD